jgi:hypothetical protein
MASTTLKTLVLKTATVGSVKLLTPADRIGLGLATVVATNYPAEHLSPGQFPLPHHPEPEPGSGSRQASSVVQGSQSPEAMAVPAVPPASSAGCPVPGSSVRCGPWSFTWLPAFGWRVTANRAAAGGRRSTDAMSGMRTPADGASRASTHADDRLCRRNGRDCQSPDRHEDEKPAMANPNSKRFGTAWVTARIATAGM